MKFSSLVSDNNCLYRYRIPVEQNILALEEDRLYFSTPSNFNDPYDNLIFINSDKIVGEVYGNLIGGMDAYLEKLRLKDPAIANWMIKNWKDEKQRNLMIENHIDTVYACIDAIRKGIRNNPKVICFSSCYDSMLMWSHYAQNHQGFVLVYDKKALQEADRYNRTDELVRNHIQLHQVKYVVRQKDMTESALAYIRGNMLENMGDVQADNAEIMQKDIRDVLTEKSMEWSYENEWRIIPRITEIGKESELHYIKCQPKAVILGSHCAPETIERLSAVCHKKNIPLYRIFLSETSPEFRLKVNDDGNIESTRTKHQVLYMG